MRDRGFIDFLGGEIKKNVQSCIRCALLSQEENLFRCSWQIDANYQTWKKTMKVKFSHVKHH